MIVWTMSVIPAVCSMNQNKMLGMKKAVILASICSIPVANAVPNIHADYDIVPPPMVLHACPWGVRASDPPPTDAGAQMPPPPWERRVPAPAACVDKVLPMILTAAAKHKKGGEASDAS